MQLSRQGYPVNKMCNSLKSQQNRDEYLADEEAYMAKYQLSEEQKQAIRERDWLKLTQLGGNLFFFLKLAATLGYGLYQIGAEMRGESYEEFMATRQVPGAV
nr:protocatechuate 3,4-dioxygenase [Oceanobacter mangrovi]